MEKVSATEVVSDGYDDGHTPDERERLAVVAYRLATAAFKQGKWKLSLEKGDWTIVDTDHEVTNCPRTI